MTYVNRLFRFINLPVLLALALILVAVMAKPVQTEQPVYAFQVAFDISQSMGVDDVSHNGVAVSRLSLAKEAAGSLLRSLPCGSKLGWSVFTGRRALTLLAPLDVCEHYAGLLASLDEIDGSMRWSNGSIIGKGLHQLMRSAHNMEDQPNVVLMTDGHEAPPLEQGQRGMPNTSKFDVTGLLVGIGGEAPVAIPKTNPDGSQAGFWQAEEVVQRPGVASGEELTRRHDEHLMMLAGLGDLHYQPLDSIRSLITAVEDEKFSQQQEASYDFRWIPATLALIFLVLRFVPGIRELFGKVKSAAGLSTVKQL